MATTLTREQKEFVPTAWENVVCPFCSAQSSSLLEAFGPEERYHYVRCEDCALAYLNPRPSYDEQFIETAYNVYISSIDDIWQGGRFTPKGQRRYELYGATLREIETFVPNRGRLLEIGCSTGLFCKVGKDAGWDVTGIDISPSSTKLGRDAFGLPLICGDWLKMPELKGPFDLIFCSHTIEHVPNPSEWMERFRSLLSADGRLCIEVPNMDCLARKLKRTLTRAGLRKPRWEKWRTPDHLFEPNEPSLRRFVEANGFEALRLCTYSRKSPVEGFWQKLYHERLRIGGNLRLILAKA